MVGGCVEVAGQNETASICLLPSAVYGFDESLYGRLQSAFEAGDRDRLNGLWSEGRPFEPGPLAP